MRQYLIQITSTKDYNEYNTLIVNFIYNSFNGLLPALYLNVDLVLNVIYLFNIYMSIFTFI